MRWDTTGVWGSAVLDWGQFRDQPSYTLTLIATIDFYIGRNLGALSFIPAVLDNRGESEAPSVTLVQWPQL